jgi:hypothetical protein
MVFSRSACAHLLGLLLRPHIRPRPRIRITNPVPTLYYHPLSFTRYDGTTSRCDSQEVMPHFKEPSPALLGFDLNIIRACNLRSGCGYQLTAPGPQVAGALLYTPSLNPYP